MRSRESRTRHLQALIWLALSAAPPLGISGCTTCHGVRDTRVIEAGGSASEQSNAGDSTLPPRSYFVETRMVALPPEQVGALQTASAFAFDQTPGWTLYSGAGALVQLGAEVTQLPFLGEDEPAIAEAEFLASASKKLRVSLRDSTAQAEQPQVEVQLHSTPGIPAVDRRGKVASDGTPLVLDSGIAHEGKVLAVSVSVHKVATREDLRRIYESKQAARDVAHQERQGRGD